MRPVNRFYLIITLLITVGLVGIAASLAMAQGSSQSETPTSKEPLTLNEALTWGLRHSGTLQKSRDQLDKVRYSLLNQEVALDWQLDLKGSTLFGPEPSGPQGLGDELTTQAELTLQGSKSFLWGLNLQPKLTYQEQDPLEWDQFSEHLNFSITATQSLFPWVPSPLEQEYRQSKNQYQQAVVSFRRDLEWEQIGWISDYLNLVRLQERLGVAERGLAQAQAKLATLRQQREVGEAGEINLLTAQIQVKQAESRYLQASTTFQQQKQAWYNKLDLPSDLEVEFTATNPYLAELHSQVRVSLINPLTSERMLQRIFKKNVQLKANQQDQRLTQQQLRWAQQKGLPQINLSGSYDYQKETWNAGLHLSYSFSQEQNRLRVQDYRSNYKKLQLAEERLKKELQLQLDQHLNQIEIDRLKAEEQELALQKAELEVKLAAQQQLAGLITQQEYQEKEINHQQVLIDHKVAEDELFVSYLRLYYLLGYELPH